MIANGHRGRITGVVPLPPVSAQLAIELGMRLRRQRPNTPIFGSLIVLHLCFAVAFRALALLAKALT